MRIKNEMKKFYNQVLREIDEPITTHRMQTLRAYNQTTEHLEAALSRSRYESHPMKRDEAGFCDGELMDIARAVSIMFAYCEHKDMDLEEALRVLYQQKKDAWAAHELE